MKEIIDYITQLEIRLGSLEKLINPIRADLITHLNDGEHVALPEGASLSDRLASSQYGYIDAVGNQVCVRQPLLELDILIDEIRTMKE